MKNISANSIAVRIWWYTTLGLLIGSVSWCLAIGETSKMGFVFIGFIASLIASTPAWFILFLCIRFMHRLPVTTSNKILYLLLIELLVCLVYATAGTILFAVSKWEYANLPECIEYILLCTGILFIFSCISSLYILKRIIGYFTSSFTSKKLTHMQSEQQHTSLSNENQQPGMMNKAMLKGIITALLILGMLVPTFFVQNLVNEREQRQKQVVSEVSSKWATAQTITTPYLHIPYTVKSTNEDKKEIVITKDLFLLPDDVEVKGAISAEERPRSIYKVLLYKSNLLCKGTITIQIPKDIPLESLQLNEAKICTGISDYKGIEERVTINIHGNTYELSPGLPNKIIDETGLSASVSISPDLIGQKLSFEMPLKLKGSGQLHFAPICGNSSFTLTSDWKNPSFDGNNLPSERIVNEKGFTAKWNFNKANLPFGTSITEFNLTKNTLAFGVSLLQPADQYSKTMRSIKYAILIIGLTFALFFIIEMMQGKAVHPVQYVLVGLALVIFYTLLLSISEFILFDYAYLIAAVATIILITFYVKSQFAKWSTAALFSGVIGALYTFIFILIRLEDTALLIGSIGLFIVLALVMYASRKINWYANNNMALSS